MDNAPADRPPGRIIPLFNRAMPQKLWASVLFPERVFRHGGAAHTYIALHAPAPDAVDEMRPAARAIWRAAWQDTGDANADLLRTMVTVLNRYVPEYAAAAAPVNQFGKPERMPRVIFALDDGQHIGLGRPMSEGDVLTTMFDRESAFTWGYYPQKPDYGVYDARNAPASRYRRIDAEAAALRAADFGDDADRPAIEILATLLAATEASRAHIFEHVYDVDPALLPPGPLRVEDPWDAVAPPERQSRPPAPRPARGA